MRSEKLIYSGCIGEMQHKIEKMQEELMKVQLKYQKVFWHNDKMLLLN